MSDITVSANVDTLLQSATFAAFLIALGSTTGTNTYTTDHTLDATDICALIVVNSATPVNITFPIAIFANKEFVIIRQKGAGQITVLTTGTTLNKPTDRNYKSRQVGSLIFVFFESSTEGDIGGDLEAAAGLTYFTANKNATIQVIGSNAATKVTFTNEITDSNGTYDAANSKFIAPVIGVLQLAGVISSTSIVDPTYALIYKNGVEIYRFSPPDLAIRPDILRTGGIPFNANIPLAATDYIEIWTQTGTVAGYTIAGGNTVTFLTGVFLPS